MEKRAGAQSQHKPEIEPLFRSTEARDEMNLAEFPLCCIADRPEPGQKTLTFEDQTWDANRREMITRRLLITGSDEYGLPTALDDEVLLGLVQLSTLQDFGDRKVHFTRYQLLRLLNWRDEGKNYHRLEKSLNRWVGVTLYYKNAWWDKGEQCWADEKFHVLDNVTLFDREMARRKKCVNRQSQLPFSSLVWNEVIFRSFKTGNLKKIDFEFFKRLESSVTKRLYRFLDKRLYRRTRCEFDLKKLAWEHIGLSRKYDTANLKRKLRTGISELERKGFLVPLSDEARFCKVRAGEWRVLIRKAKFDKNEQTNEPFVRKEAEALKAALVQRGVTPGVAQNLMVTYPVDRVRSQIEVFDWLKSRNDRRVSKNPSGFLVSAIKAEYVAPEAFLFERKRKRHGRVEAENRRQLGGREQAAQEKEKARLDAQADAIQSFWNSFSDGERQRLEAETLAGASPFQRNLATGRGALACAARQHILDRFALTKLAEEKADRVPSYDEQTGSAAGEMPQ